jgi:hypothetical protein
MAVGLFVRLIVWRVVVAGVAVVALSAAMVGSDRVPSGREVEDARGSVVGGVRGYVKAGQLEPPADASRWQSFFARQGQRVKELRKRFDRWSRLVDRRSAHSRGASVRKMVAMRDASKVWLSDQEEQLSLRIGCFLSRGSLANPLAAQNCWTMRVQANGQRWDLNRQRAANLLRVRIVAAIAATDPPA